MAITVGPQDGDQNTQTQPNAGAGMTAPNPGAPNPNRGKSLISLFRQIETPASLTESARNYAKDLIKFVKERAMQHGNMNIEITLLDTLAVPTIMFEYRGMVVPVMLPGPNSGINDDTPPTAALIDILEVYRQRREGMSRPNVVSSTIIDEHSYGVNQLTAMGCGIINIFKTNDMANDITLDALNAQMLQIDTTMSNVIDQIRAMSPHAVLPRTEFGFVLSAVTGQGNQQNQGFFDVNTQRVHPLGVVSGYVEIINEGRQKDSHPVFTPVVHISEINTVMPHIKMLELLMCTFATLVFSNQIWKRQFERFSDNEPNIGNMIFDNTKNPPEPYRIDNPVNLDSFIANFLVDPIIVLDVVDGRFRVPGIEMFAMPDKSRVLQSEMEKLVGVNIAINGNVSNPLWSEFTGVFMDKDGVPTDSRYIDYLRLMVNNKHQQKVVLPFATRIINADPKLRIRDLRQFYPHLKVTNNCTVCTPNPVMLRTMQDILSVHMRVSSTLTGGQAVVSLGQYVSSWAEAYRGVSGFGAGRGYDVGATGSFQSRIYNF